jgi:hypothetical protein
MAIASARHIVPTQLGKLERRLKEVDGQLLCWLRGSIRNHNDFVGGKIEECRDAFIRAVRPFFGGPEKEILTRRDFENMHIPLVYEIGRAEWGEEVNPKDSSFDVAKTSSRFVEFRKEMFAKFGWGDPTA